MRLLIDLAPGDPRRGLAIDEALLESVRGRGEDAVRLWVNDRAVIVGRSQLVLNEVDVGFSTHNRIAVLRRISGGGAVYHYPGNLNLSIVLGDGRRLGSVGETFRFLGRAIASCLADVCPTISARENNLLVGEAKVGGAAQARRGDAILYHTTLLVGPVDVPMDGVLLAMRPGYCPQQVASRPRQTVSLGEATGSEVSMERLAKILAQAVSNAVARSLTEARLGDEEARRVGWLVEHKYGDPQWNRSL